jgi:hypothetical protein
VLNLGLEDRDDFDAYLASLSYSHPMRLTVRILDQDDKAIGHLTAPASDVEAGTVTVDATQDVTRTLSLTVIDRKGALHIDPDSPRRATVYPDHQIHVIREDWVNALDDWVECPVFRGPMTRFQRAGGVVTLEGMGKEVLSQTPNVLWTAHNYAVGDLHYDAIRELLEEMGETRFSLPANSPALHKVRSYGRGIEVWKVCQRLAGKQNQLYYDARGRVRLRPLPTRPVYTFHDGIGGNILTLPSIDVDFVDSSNFWNAVTVVGKKEHKGARGTVKFTAVAPVHNPLSPESLARNGKPRYVWAYVTDTTIKRVDGPGGAQEVATLMLDRGLRLVEQVTFDALPVPCLEPMDVVNVVADVGAIDVDVKMPLRQFVIPLTAQGTMSVGTTRRAGRRPTHSRGFGNQPVQRAGVPTIAESTAAAGNLPGAGGNPGVGAGQ